MQALWFFTSDLVFVLLFPQLVCALFDPKANRIGSIAAFAVSLVLRSAAASRCSALPAVIPYPETLPFKTARRERRPRAAAAGVSRHRALGRARPLRNVV